MRTYHQAFEPPPGSFALPGWSGSLFGATRLLNLPMGVVSNKSDAFCVARSWRWAGKLFL